MFEKDPPSRWKSLENIIIIIIGIILLILLSRMFNVGLGEFLNIKLK